MDENVCGGCKVKKAIEAQHTDMWLASVLAPAACMCVCACVCGQAKGLLLIKRLSHRSSSPKK